MAMARGSPALTSGFRKGPIPGGGVGRAPSGESDESTRRTGDCIITVSGLEVRFGDVTSSASAGSSVAVGLGVWFSDVASPDSFCPTVLIVPLSP